MIRAENIKYEYIRRDDHGDVVAVETALDAVSFRIEAGQFIGIIGPNGSGKSTLAKHLNALLIPEEGTLWVDDIDTSDSSMTLEVRSNVGMIFQNPDNQIVADITEDDVAFGPENLGVPVDELRSRVDDALAVVGMSDKALTNPSRMSGGQKAKVAIAGVLAMRPKCMVFDESLAMLDPMGREEVMNQVIRLNKGIAKGSQSTEPITVIWITHNPEEVVYADRIFVMDKGKLALTGTPKEVFSKVTYLGELGLAVPQATALAYKLKVKGINIPDGILTGDELVKYLERM